MAGVLMHLPRLKDDCWDTLSSRFACWTKPLRTSLPLATFTDLGRSKSELIAENACAGYIARLFSKETVFTLECRRSDPSFPAFLPGSRSLHEGPDCLDHDSYSACSPGAIHLVSRCVLSSPAMLSV